MSHPGSLIRWGALGAVVLLVRAIVRESRAQRAPVILLPPADARAGSRRGAGRSDRARAQEWDVADEAAEGSGSASGTAESGSASGPADSGPGSGPTTRDSKLARE
jgi:hypothetical protein